MKILVTGGTGLVGSAFKSISSSYNHEFKFLSSRNCDLLIDSSFDYEIKSFNPDLVVHLAANVGGLFKNMSQNVTMFEDNFKINYNVVSSCFKNGVKNFIGMLSTCIFPDGISYPISEESIHAGPPHESNYGYAYAKRMLDVQCKTYRDQYDLKYHCIIPTNIYGENDNYNLKDSHVIPALIHKCYLAKLNQEPFLVSGSGKALRQFIYAQDLSKAMLELIGLMNENIIISTSEEYSIKDIADMIASYFDYSHMLKFDTSKSDGQLKKTADNSKFKDLLPNFEFTDLKIGLTKTIEYFVCNYNNIRI